MVDPFRDVVNNYSHLYHITYTFDVRTISYIIRIIDKNQGRSTHHIPLFDTFTTSAIDILEKCIFNHANNTFKEIGENNNE